jgi:PAS domain S-box-containing protein
MDTKPLRVLIVGQKEDGSSVALRELRRGGFDPKSCTVEDRDGISSALDSEWDVALCGGAMQMLEMPTAIAMIRERRPTLPVIVVSSTVGDEEEAILMSKGASDVVQRADLLRLVPALRRAMAESAARRARMLTDEVLQHSEKRFRSLFTDLPVGIFRTDSNGSLLSANPAMREMLGLGNIYEVVRATIGEFVVDRRKQREIWSRLARGAPRLEFEIQLRRRSGEIFWALMHVVSSRGDDGKATHTDGVIQDVNSRKTLEKALMQGKKEWEHTFDAVRQLVVVVDLNGTIVRCNRALARTLEVDVQTMPGRSFFDILGAPSDQGERQTLVDMIRNGRSDDVDIVAEALGGEFRFSVSPRIDVDGRALGAILVGGDVTLTRNEEQLRRLRGAIEQAERIFATIRHEVGNTLNTLKTTLSVFRMKIDVFDNDQKAIYFNRCFETLGIAERLLRSLRSYQTFDRLNIETIHLGDFLDRRMAIVFETARAGDIECEAVTCGEDLFVRADADALVRVILNLVDNAIAAVNEIKHAKITVRCSSLRGVAVLEVNDNGNGIPEDELPLVFTPLHTTKAEGSGMGLAIVQKLLVNMGGVAEIQSRLGVGTTVILKLPLVDATNTNIRLPSQS